MMWAAQQQHQQQQQQPTSMMWPAQQQHHHHQQQQQQQPPIKLEENMWSLGSRNILVTVSEYAGVVKVHVRHYDQDAASQKLVPTKKGVALTQDEWEDLKQHIIRVEDCIRYKEENTWILTGDRNILVKVWQYIGKTWVHIRQYFNCDAYTLTPTKRGVALTLMEWATLKELITQVDQAFEGKKKPSTPQLLW